jgi:hypothetical protein
MERVDMGTRMDDSSSLTDLHGLSLAEAMNRLWQTAINCAVPVVAAQLASRAQDLIEKMIPLLKTFGRKNKNSCPQPEPADAYEAKARQLLEAQQVNCVTLEIGSQTTFQLIGCPLDQRDREALGREALEAFEPLIVGLRNGTIEAEGILNLNEPRRIPPHHFRATCTLYRHGARIIFHDNRGKPRLTYSAVHLSVAAPERLRLGEAVRQAMDVLQLPLGPTTNRWIGPVLDWLKENGYQARDRPTPQGDEALRAHIKRAQKLRNEEARLKR